MFWPPSRWLFLVSAFQASLLKKLTRATLKRSSSKRRCKKVWKRLLAKAALNAGAYNADQPAAVGEPYFNDAQSQPMEMPVEMPSYTYSSPAPSSCNCAAKKKKKEAAMAAYKKAYAGVFYGNNFSYLNDPNFDGPRHFSDNFKNMKTPLGTLSLGGETRYRFMNERNFAAAAGSVPGVTGFDDNYWLTRQRLYADWKLSDSLRVYGEVLDAQKRGEEFGTRPIDENDLDIQNLFVDVKLFDNDYGKFTARVGRQELIYGAQRTVSPLDWANTRRTFEGVRGLYQNGDTSIDAFWTEFVPVDPDSRTKLTTTDSSSGLT